MMRGSGTANRGGGLPDPGDGVVRDGVPADHPGHGSVGDFAGCFQHQGGERGDDDGEGRGVGAGESGSDAVHAAFEVDRAFFGEGPENRHVFPHVARRALVLQSERLDAGRMGGPDAQNESSARERVDCGGLQGESVRVPGIRWDDGGPKLYGTRSLAGEPDHRQRIEGCYLGHPVAVESSAFETCDFVHETGERRIASDVTAVNPDLHACLASLAERCVVR